MGNLDAARDWGYAKEYVEAMWLMLQAGRARRLRRRDRHLLHGARLPASLRSSTSGSTGRSTCDSTRATCGQRRSTA